MLRSSLLLATASLLATPALGQTAPDSEEIVVTAQRGNRAVVERGGSVGVLGEQPAENVPFQIRSYTEALILDQQPQSLGQVLENDPTVRTSYGFGNAAEQFVIRGFTLFGDDVGMDGLYGITPRQLVAPELYQSVQVLNGASAFLNGAAPGGSGIGGSINLIPKRAGIQPLARVTAGYTSSGQVGVGFDVARRWNDGAFGLRLNGAHRRGEVAIDEENRRSTVLGAGLDWRGERVRLSLDLGYQRVRVEQLRPKVTVTTFIPRVPDADANYAQPWTYTDLEDIFGIAKAEVDLSENVLLYGQIGARDGSEYGIYSGITAVAPDGEATGSALFVPRTDNNEAGQAGIRAKTAFAGTTHDLNLGASHVRQVNRNAYDFLGGFAPFATDLYDTPEVALPGTGFVGGDLDDPFAISRTRLTSVFVSDTIGLAQDRVLITAGLRHQRVRVKGYSYADGSLEREYDEDAVTPVIGVVVKPRDGLSLYANRIEGLQQGPVAPNDPTISNPGEIFAPYKSVQYEAGAKLGFGGFNAGLAFFRTSLPSAGSVADEDNPGLFRYGLFGRQRNRGVEFTIDGDVTSSLRVIAGVSLLDATLRRTPGGTNDGNRAPGVPTYLANANVEWDVPSLRGLTLTGRAVSTGKQQVDAANTLGIGRWTRFDAGARYVLVAGDRPLTLRAGVDNLFNKRYWSSAFETFGASLLQGQPRTFRLSTSIDL
ncbi:TonB-dependent siderophore receptor [Sphingomonas sp. LY29]|uniref:TonB-dependent receptor n=1 Tax=Sphingomonas sp. LY29 TaxID=3095341 RepID=UPI002D78EC30|nr:TonB-dependent siderophore receptor [Sphingomonas sp. LY29]WRP26847.1 TonB-dependent siderophore receptor [Sphingomonas sp. LY29]